ncbi:MAG: PglZ domain-containing protein [Flavobacteriales bacterium]|nr:PglZ domain-containing protein [Flavobacteriales bacterium]
MDQIKILWVDDEIDLLKPHVMFLEGKGYEVQTATNGSDALDMIKETDFEIVFLDENMPGLSGLETLTEIKNKRRDLPVVMITKSEEEHIMEDAIGSKIADYLIKPVNPNQILLSLKKILDQKRIIGQKTTSAYQREFGKIGMTLGDRLSHEDWTEVYKKLVHWEMELSGSETGGMEEILLTQKADANNLFGRFIENNYRNWLNGKDPNPPLLSHTLFRQKVAPKIRTDKPLFLIVIDNLRFDQWRVLQSMLNSKFKTDEEQLYYSILPTATQFARNAFFAGLMPSEIQKKYPKLWVGEEDEGGKNMHEEELLGEQLKRLGKNVKFSYHKITNLTAGKRLADQMNGLAGNSLNVIVYNFVDMLSHARTDMEVIRELADDEAAYRSLTASWFEHSPLNDIFDKIADMGADVVVTTDHGTIRVKDPSKVVGERETSTNLRYKQGRNLRYESRDVMDIGDPAEVFLPKLNVSTRYIFAKESKFFAYPNNYNYYVNFYRNTFQHGGISLEEMLIPVIHLSPR